MSGSGPEFTVIPAVDIRGGRAVRLHQGRFDRETVFVDDPIEAAARFLEAGARRLHVVDLDGAKAGIPTNLAIVRGIVDAAGDVPVQTGGGLRRLTDIDAVMGAGARWAILGTAALEQPDLIRRAADRYPGRILAAVDARKGRVAVRGWLEESEMLADALVRQLTQAGIAGVIYTDVERDGTGMGPDLALAAELARLGGLPVIASGGVGSLAHIRSAAARAVDGVVGVIVGQALYDGRLTLHEAQDAAQPGPPC